VAQGVDSMQNPMRQRPKFDAQDAHPSWQLEKGVTRHGPGSLGRRFAPTHH